MRLPGQLISGRASFAARADIRSEEVDKVAGLEAGADDYVTKPFSPRCSAAAPAPQGLPLRNLPYSSPPGPSLSCVHTAEG